MFETEPIRFLQSHASDWFTWFMLLITSMGSAFVRDLAISVVLFGVSLRKGFLLATVCLLTAVSTDLCKNIFALQRPFEADGGIVDLEYRLLFYRPPRAGAGLFQAVGIFSYSSEIPSYSFPSGHASTATVVWGGVYWLFRSRLTRWLALALVPLVMFSRVYLGKHFIGDVIGGVMIGGIGLGLIHIFHEHFLQSGRTIEQVQSLTRKNRRTLCLLICLLCIPLAVSLTAPAIKVENLGSLFGLHIAFFILSGKGLPDDEASLSKRLARIAIGVTTIICVRLMITPIGSVVDFPPGAAFQFLQASASSCFSVLATIALARWLRLYETKRESSGPNEAL